MTSALEGWNAQLLTASERLLAVGDAARLAAIDFGRVVTPGTGGVGITAPQPDLNALIGELKRDGNF